MPAVPTRRLLVYVAMGTIVLVTGAVGVISMRGGSAPGVAATGGDGPSAASVDGMVILGGDSTLGEAVAAVAGDPSFTTTTTQAPLVYVQVAGAVRRPGVYQVSPDSRVFQVVLEAGGFTEDADQTALVLAAKVSDGGRIYVPRLGEEVGESSPWSPDPGGGASTTSTGLVSLNSATLEQLDALPGIGPAIAQDILTYRETHGPFTAVDQLADVPGIGPAKLERLRPLVGL